MLKIFTRLAARLVILGIRHVFLGILDLLGQHRGIEVDAVQSPSLPTTHSGQST